MKSCRRGRGQNSGYKNGPRLRLRMRSFFGKLKNSSTFLVTRGDFTRYSDFFKEFLDCQIHQPFYMKTLTKHRSLVTLSSSTLYCSQRREIAAIIEKKNTALQKLEIFGKTFSPTKSDSLSKNSNDRSLKK